MEDGVESILNVTVICEELLRVDSDERHCGADEYCRALKKEEVPQSQGELQWSRVGEGGEEPARRELLDGYVSIVHV